MFEWQKFATNQVLAIWLIYNRRIVATWQNEREWYCWNTCAPVYFSAINRGWILSKVGVCFALAVFAEQGEEVKQVSLQLFHKHRPSCWFSWISTVNTPGHLPSLTLSLTHSYWACNALISSQLPTFTRVVCTTPNTFTRSRKSPYRWDRERRKLGDVLFANPVCVLLFSALRWQARKWR